MGDKPGHPTFLESAWPVVIVTTPAEFEETAVSTFRAEFERIFARRAKFALLVDTTATRSIPNARWRKDLADWMMDPAFQARQVKYNVGSANLIRSAPVRGALTALSWFWKAPTPQGYPKDLREGVEWCIERLADHGVSPSPALIEYLERLKTTTPIGSPRSSS
jgi:hypothetical protein